MTRDDEYAFYARPENQEPQGKPHRRSFRPIRTVRAHLDSALYADLFKELALNCGKC
jgi:hypothetical protein